MKPIEFPRLREELESRVHAKTSRRVRNLTIMLSPEGVVLRGRALSFYDKQMAQHGVREMLPEVRLQNAIEVA